MSVAFGEVTHPSLELSRWWPPRPPRASWKQSLPGAIPVPSISLVVSQGKELKMIIKLLPFLQDPQKTISASPDAYQLISTLLPFLLLNLSDFIAFRDLFFHQCFHFTLFFTDKMAHKLLIYLTGQACAMVWNRRLKKKKWLWSEGVGQVLFKAMVQMTHTLNMHNCCSSRNSLLTSPSGCGTHKTSEPEGSSEPGTLPTASICT